MRAHRFAPIVGYVILALAIVFAFWRTAEIRDEVQLETERRAFVICETSNENRLATTELFRDVLFLGDDLINELEPSVQNYLETVRPEREAFISRAEEELAPTECPPNPDGITIPVPGSDLEEDGDGETDPVGETPEDER